MELSGDPAGGEIEGGEQARGLVVHVVVGWAVDLTRLMTPRHSSPRPPEGPGIAAVAASLAEVARSEGWDYETCLAQVLSAEVTSRESRGGAFARPIEPVGSPTRWES
jgi:hypothetical protein